MPVWTRDRVRRAHVLLVLLLIFSLLYLGLRVVGTSVLANPYPIKLELPWTGGLFPGSVVTYRGREIGKVANVGLDGDGAVALLQIKRQFKVPKDVDVDIAMLSPVGEQYVDILPRSESGPFLAEGATLAPTKLTLPKPVADFFLHVDQATRKVKPEDIGKLIDEMFTVVAGAGPDFASLLDSSERLFLMFERVEPYSMQIMSDGKKLLDTMVEFRPEWKRFTSDMTKITEEIKKSDAAFRQLMDSGAILLDEFEEFWPEGSQDIASLMNSGSVLADVMNERVPAIDTGLRALPAAIDLVYDLVEGGKLRGRGLFSNSETCRYDMVKIQDPAYGIPTKNNIYAYCPRFDPDVQQRGAYFAPRPPGDDTAIPKRP